MSSNYSADVAWEITRNASSYIVKRGHGSGKVLFSKDPLNLTNRHSRKQAGVVNDKAVGVQPKDTRGVVLITKTKQANSPSKLYSRTPLTKYNRRVYGAIAASVAKTGYRPDLRSDAVARASSILNSQRTKKPTPEKKARGKKAQSV